MSSPASEGWVMESIEQRMAALEARDAERERQFEVLRQEVTEVVGRLNAVLNAVGYQLVSATEAP